MKKKYIDYFLSAVHEGVIRREAGEPSESGYNKQLVASFYHNAYEKRTTNTMQDFVTEAIVQSGAYLAEVTGSLQEKGHTAHIEFILRSLKQGWAQPKWLSVTIGMVRVDGEAVQNDIFVDEMNDAYKPVPADMHVWITCLDMTVIDLTIAQRLKTLLLDLPHQMSDKGPFVWHPSSPEGVTYMPMIVDDNFHSRNYEW